VKCGYTCNTVALIALMVASLIVLSGAASADLLWDHFGVDLDLDLAAGYTDIYQSTTSYPFDASSFIPTKITKTGHSNWIVNDWWGSWNASDDPTEYQSAPGAGQYPTGAEPYDVEAMYVDIDASNMYIAIVTSFDPSPGYTEQRLGLPYTLVVTGDLAIDLHGKGVNTPFTDGFSYDYGVNINHEVRPDLTADDATSGGATIGNEVYETYNSDWYIGTPSAAVPAGGEHTNFDPNYSYGGYTFLGTQKGTATVDYYEYTKNNFATYQETLYPTYIIEVTMGLSLLPALQDGDLITIGWVEGCRNDGNETDACLRLEVPEPGTMSLMALGICALGWLRRRRLTD